MKKGQEKRRLQSRLVDLSVVRQHERWQPALPIKYALDVRPEIAAQGAVERLRRSVRLWVKGRREAALDAQEAAQLSHDRVGELAASVGDQGDHGTESADPAVENGRGDDRGVLGGHGADVGVLSEGVGEDEDVLLPGGTDRQRPVEVHVHANIGLARNFQCQKR